MEYGKNGEGLLGKEECSKTGYTALHGAFLWVFILMIITLMGSGELIGQSPRVQPPKVQEQKEQRYTLLVSVFPDGNLNNEDFLLLLSEQLAIKLLEERGMEPTLENIKNVLQEAKAGL